MNKEIADWPPEKYLPTSDAFLDAKQQSKDIPSYNAQQIADGAKSGRWAQQNRQSGAVAHDMQGAPINPAPVNPTLSSVSFDQVQPSADFKDFRGDGFSISYPANWQALAGQNSVTFAPAAGVGQNAVAYGAILDTAQNVDAGSLNDATQSLIQNLQQTNPGLRVYQSPRKIQVAGGNGLSTMLSGNSPILEGDHPLTERDWLITLPRPAGGMLHLVFIAPEKDFERMQPTFQKMLESLQVK